MSLIGQLLDPKSVRISLKSTSKDDVIHELVDIMEAAGAVFARTGVVDALMERESEMSTGLHNGIALPHCKTDATNEIYLVVALKKDGIDFESMDGKPARIFFYRFAERHD